MDVLVHVHLNYLLHVFFLNKIHDLSAAGNNLEGLAGHRNLLVLENLPVREPGHNFRKNLVEVFIDR